MNELTAFTLVTGLAAGVFNNNSALLKAKLLFFFFTERLKGRKASTVTRLERLSA